MKLYPSRRAMLAGLGATALTGAMGGLSNLGGGLASTLGIGRARAATHFAPRARRVVHLFQSGSPSQLETFDYKPGLAALDGTDLPESVRDDQRLTTMTSGMARMSPTAAVGSTRWSA